jgi:HK97 family phage prohead protease
MAKYTADQLKALGAKGHAFKNAAGEWSYPIDDEEDLANAIRAVGRGGAEHDAIRRYIMGRAKDMGKADAIPDSWQSDGSLARSETFEVLGAGGPVTRSFELADISIRAGGDGRTVLAYAAVFNRDAEIRDQDGHYIETIDPVAFNRTLQDQAGQIGVFYNHGRTLYGTPSERFSLPLGTPEEVRADNKGLFTATRYNRSQLADEVLESIRNGDITGHSFSGRFVESRRTRATGRGELDRIHRSQVSLREYGPTPIPAYKEAALVGLRMDDLADTLRQLSDAERAHLHQLLDTSSGAPSPTVDAGYATAAVTPAPDSHAGPTPTERRQRLLVISGRTSNR